jgi:hypothetical protein
MAVVRTQWYYPVLQGPSCAVPVVGHSLCGVSCVVLFVSCRMQKLLEFAQVDDDLTEALVLRCVRAPSSQSLSRTICARARVIVALPLRCSTPRHGRAIGTPTQRAYTR